MNLDDLNFTRERIKYFCWGDVSLEDIFGTVKGVYFSGVGVDDLLKDLHSVCLLHHSSDVLYIDCRDDGNTDR